MRMVIYRKFDIIEVEGGIDYMLDESGVLKRR